MSRMPAVGPRDVIRVLERASFVAIRVRGSHYQLFNPNSGRRVTVPHHNRDLTRSTLAAIVSQSGLTIEQFLERL